MKKILFFLAVLSMVLYSCNKDENIQRESNDGLYNYKYKKVLSIIDRDGNSALVEIASDDENSVNAILEEDLELLTTIEIFNETNGISTNNSSFSPSVSAKSQKQKDYSKYTLIDIVEFDLNDNVTGFVIQFKPKSSASRSIKYYEYGNNGVRGTRGVFWGESGSIVNYEFEILKKSSSWWYTEIFDEDMHVIPGPEDHWLAYYNSHKYYKYRVELPYGYWSRFSWWWLTN